MTSIASANDIYRRAKENDDDVNRAKINKAGEVYSLARKSALEKYNLALKNYKHEV